ncbi:MAG: TylF/MycF/NovP-related O-methyltransferase [Opitutales bacterium]
MANPTLPRTHLVRVRGLMVAGRSLEAVESLLLARRSFPRNPEINAFIRRLRPDFPEQLDTQHEDTAFAEILRKIRPHSILGKKELFALFTAARTVTADAQEGAFVECGNAGGGSLLLLALFSKIHAAGRHRVWAFDSFTGMPGPSQADTIPEDRPELIARGAGPAITSEADVKRLLKMFRTRSLVTVRPGLFEDTLPTSRNRIGPIALLHIDAPWHLSTKTALNHLYDRVIPGGIIQIEGHGAWPGCTKAVKAFIRRRQLNLPITRISESCISLKKT